MILSIKRFGRRSFSPGGIRATVQRASLPVKSPAVALYETLALCSQPWKGFIHRSPRHRLGERKNKICALEGHFNQPASVPKYIFHRLLYQCAISAVFLKCPFRAQNLIFALPGRWPGATMDMPFQGRRAMPNESIRQHSCQARNNPFRNITRQSVVTLESPPRGIRGRKRPAVALV